MREDGSIDFVHNPNKHTSIDTLDECVSDVNSFSGANRRIDHLPSSECGAARKSIDHQLKRNLLRRNRIENYTSTYTLQRENKSKPPDGRNDDDDDDNDDGGGGD